MGRMIRRLLQIARREGWRAPRPTRREILKSSAGAAAAAMLGSLVAPIARAQPARLTRVAVVGAGFGGLACAEELLAGGVDVAVFEAESRVGGRVLTDHKLFTAAPVELGGEFIGENHPTWFALAKKHGVELAELPEEEGEEGYILGGKLLKGEQLKSLHDEIQTLLDRAIELAREIDPIRPFDAANAAELDQTSLLDWVRKSDVSDDAKAIYIADEESDNGVLAARMSLLAYLAMVAGGGFDDYFELSETHRCPAGNDALARAMAAAMGDRVKLKTAIKAIQRQQNLVRLTSEAGEVFEAQAVVLATPPTAWERIAIDPPLPAELAPQFGKNIKLILKCNKPFWKDTDLAPEIYSDGLIQIGWNSADGGEEGVAYTLFNGADKTEAFRAIPADERTRRACEAMSPAFPGMIEHVTRDMFVDWPGMPRVRGSYSFPAPGEVTRLGRTLVDGIADGLAPLMFAGEYASYAFMGYMEGALSSGVRVARQLLGK